MKKIYEKNKFRKITLERLSQNENAFSSLEYSKMTDSIQLNTN